MKKVKNKRRLCGNCYYLAKNKETRYTQFIKYACPYRWWNMRPNMMEPCENHKFKREIL